jgi:hypothetical protein
MSKITIIDNEFAFLWFHPETKIVHHEIKKYVFGKHLREILDQGYEQMKKTGAQKWLSDDRKNNALSPEDGEWAQNDWSPRVIKAGWKYWAIVLPEKVMGQMNMRLFIDSYTKVGVTVQIFSNPDEALKWLERQ